MLRFDFCFIRFNDKNKSKQFISKVLVLDRNGLKFVNSHLSIIVRNDISATVHRQLLYSCGKQETTSITTTFPAASTAFNWQNTGCNCKVATGNAMCLSPNSLPRNMHLQKKQNTHGHLHQRVTFDFYNRELKPPENTCYKGLFSSYVGYRWCFASQNVEITPSFHLLLINT